MSTSKRTDDAPTDQTQRKPRILDASVVPGPAMRQWLIESIAQQAARRIKERQPDDDEKGRHREQA